MIAAIPHRKYAVSRHGHRVSQIYRNMDAVSLQFLRRHDNIRRAIDHSRHISASVWLVHTSVQVAVIYGKDRPSIRTGGSFDAAKQNHYCCNKNAQSLFYHPLPHFHAAFRNIVNITVRTIYATPAAKVTNINVRFQSRFFFNPFNLPVCNMYDPVRAFRLFHIVRAISFACPAACSFVKSISSGASTYAYKKGSIIHSKFHIPCSHYCSHMRCVCRYGQHFTKYFHLLHPTTTHKLDVLPTFLLTMYRFQGKSNKVSAYIQPSYP